MWRCDEFHFKKIWNAVPFRNQDVVSQLLIPYLSQLSQLLLLLITRVDISIACGTLKKLQMPGLKILHILGARNCTCRHLT